MNILGNYVIKQAKKKKISSIFIFNLLNSQFIQKLIEAYASGTTILHAGSSVKKMKFILPTDKVLDMYKNNEMKKFHLIINLLDKNKILKQQLNRLPSSVSDKQVPIKPIDPKPRSPQVPVSELLR